MLERLNETYYSSIANCLNAIIPVQWRIIALNAEVEPDAVTLYFYFYDETKQLFVQSGELYKSYGINRKEYKILISELSDLILDLHTDIKEKIGDDWTTFSFVLNSNGSFKTKFGYEVLENSSQMERRDAWEKAYLVLEA